MNVVSKMYFLIALCGLLVSGCGAFHDKKGSTSAAQLAAFAVNVRPVLQSNCFSCHSDSTNAAASSFYMHPTDVERLHAESFNRITPGSPDTSRLLVKGMGNGGAHGGGPQLPRPEDQEKIRQWILTASAGQENTPSGSLFMTNVVPVLRTNCKNCHDSTLQGSAAVNSFSMNFNDPQLLYNEVFRRVVPNDPDNSLILKKGKGGNGHGGGNQLPIASDIAKLEQWIRSSEVGSGPGVGGGPSGGGGSTGPTLKFTADLRVPSGLTTGGIYQYLRFPLAALGHNGAFIEVGVRYLTDGVYEFSQWRVYSPSYPLRVVGVNVFVSSGTRSNSSNTMATSVLEAPQSQAADSNATPSLPGAVLSNRAAIVPFLLEPGDNNIKLGFTDVLRSTGGGNAAEQAFFINNVRPILSMSCFRCHGDSTANGNFNMPTTDNVILYQNSKARVTPRVPADSLLLKKGKGDNHRGGAILSPAQQVTISDWINMIQ